MIRTPSADRGARVGDGGLGQHAGGAARHPAAAERDGVAARPHAELDADADGLRGGADPLPAAFVDVDRADVGLADAQVPPREDGLDPQFGVGLDPAAGRHADLHAGHFLPDGRDRVADVGGSSVSMPSGSRGGCARTTRLLADGAGVAGEVAGTMGSAGCASSGRDPFSTACNTATPPSPTTISCERARTASPIGEHFGDRTTIVRAGGAGALSGSAYRPMCVLRHSSMPSAPACEGHLPRRVRPAVEQNAEARFVENRNADFHALSYLDPALRPRRRTPSSSTPIRRPAAAGRDGFSRLRRGKRHPSNR
jgi:hypothetical protein